MNIEISPRPFPELGLTLGSVKCGSLMPKYGIHTFLLEGSWNNQIAPKVITEAVADPNAGVHSSDHSPRILCAVFSSVIRQFASLLVKAAMLWDPPISTKDKPTDNPQEL